MTRINKVHDCNYGNGDSQHLKGNSLYGTNRNYRQWTEGKNFSL